MNYTILYAFASKNGLSYSELCTTVRDAIADDINEVQRLRELAAACYAGLVAECDLPDEWADAFLAASEGQSFIVDGLLPYTAPKASEAVGDTQRCANCGKGSRVGSPVAHFDTCHRTTPQADPAK